MKYLKTFDNLNEGEPEEGDYVIMRTDASHSGVVDFINNNIGKIVNICYKIEQERNIKKVYVEYPYTDIVGFFDYKNVRIFNFYNIKWHSKNKEDLEVMLNAKKYNL